MKTLLFTAPHQNDLIDNINIWSKYNNAYIASIDFTPFDGKDVTAIVHYKLL